MTRIPSVFVRIAGVALLVGATLLLAACPPRENSEAINRDPGRFHGREITVAGRVMTVLDTCGFSATNMAYLATARALP